jgi:hypothetical protein
MTNRDSYLVFLGVAGFIFTVVTVGCASSRTKGNIEDAAVKKGGDATVITSADSTVDRELPKTQIDLCNGSAEVRLGVFRGSSGGGYSKLPTSTNGQTIVLDGKCQIFIQRAWWDPIHVRTLTPAEIEELKTALRVEEWPAIAGTYYLDDCLAYYRAWVVGYEVVIGHKACPSTGEIPVYKGEGPVPISEPPISDIDQRADEYRNEHYDEGTPVSGPVRYALYWSGKEPTNDFYRGAEPWPFGDPGEVVITYEEAQSSPSTYANKFQVVDGEQAAVLRELRRRFIAGEIGYENSRPPRSSTDGIPILQSDGKGYELYVTDTLPYEDDTGLLTLPSE